MSLTTQTPLGQHVFQGPFMHNNQLAALSGVYLITTLANNGLHTVLDVGESYNLLERISNHDRTQQWRNNAINGIFAWTLHCDEQTRMAIERAVRLAYQPVCGDR